MLSNVALLRARATDAPMCAEYTVVPDSVNPKAPYVTVSEMFLKARVRAHPCARAPASIVRGPRVPPLNAWRVYIF